MWRALRADGYRVLPVSDGPELLEALGNLISDPARPERPDLIVADFELAGYRGIDILTGLRHEGWDTPFVMLVESPSAARQIAERRHADVEAIAFPFDIDELRIAADVLARFPQGPAELAALTAADELQDIAGGGSLAQTSPRPPADERHVAPSRARERGSGPGTHGERRGARRVAVRLMVEEVGGPERAARPCTNLSLTGMYLRDSSFAVKGHIGVHRLRLPASAAPLDLLCEVVRVELNGDGSAVGLRFLHLEPAARRRLQEFLSAAA